MVQSLSSFLYNRQARLDGLGLTSKELRHEELMTDFRFDPGQMKNRKLHRRKATIRILSRLRFSAAEIARIDGDCTPWDPV